MVGVAKYRHLPHGRSNGMLADDLWLSQGDVDHCGVDLRPRAVEIAQSRAEKAGAAVRFAVLQALTEELPSGFDIVMCSLFLHHLNREEAVTLLAKMATTARHMVLVNDLVRSRRGLILAHLAARLLTVSSVVWVDAPRSVRTAFTIDEVQELALAAGLAGVTVSRRWPCRMLLEWKRP